MPQKIYLYTSRNRLELCDRSETGLNLRDNGPELGYLSLDLLVPGLILLAQGPVLLAQLRDASHGVLVLVKKVLLVGLEKLEDAARVCDTAMEHAGDHLLERGTQIHPDLGEVMDSC